jgi:glycosyltransferase involved in cell wall biosynthesis
VPKAKVVTGMDPATLDVTIVVPYFNPGPALRATIDDTVAVLAASEVTFEVITVSDGSTDGSELTLADLPNDVIRRVVLERNRGKGQALQVGLAMGRGRYLGFLDADGDISPELLSPFVSLMRLYEPDFIMGSKRHPMSEVQYPMIRRAYSWGYQQVIRILFRLDVRDTQVGIKLINREVIEAVLPLLVESRFAFDLELIVVARHLGYDRLFEAPVRIDHRFRSTISLRAVFGMLADTLRVFVRLHVLRAYDKGRIPPLDLKSASEQSLDEVSNSHRVRP